MLYHMYIIRLKWTYLVATYDGIMARMYVDSELVAQVRKYGCTGP